MWIISLIMKQIIMKLLVAARDILQSRVFIKPDFHSAF